MAVACAATFVPFLVCLNPSTPHERKRWTAPFASLMLKIVLLGETLMLNIGTSLKGIPLNSLFDMSPSGKKLNFLKENKCLPLKNSVFLDAYWFIRESMSTDFSPAVPWSFLGTDLNIILLSSTSLNNLELEAIPRIFNRVVSNTKLATLEKHVFNIFEQLLCRLFNF